VGQEVDVIEVVLYDWGARDVLREDVLEDRCVILAVDDPVGRPRRSCGNGRGKCALDYRSHFARRRQEGARGVHHAVLDRFGWI